MVLSKQICVIGVGRTAEQHVRAIQAIDGLAIRSCASRSQARADDFAARFGIREARLIDDVFARPDADALWIVAPADRMAEAAMRAAATGLPCFLEKPVGFGSGEAAVAVAAFRAPTLVGLNRRFYEVVREGKRLVEEHGGARHIEVHMPEDVRRLSAIHSSRTVEHWQFANSVHLIDLFRFFGGSVTEITTRNSIRSPQDRNYAALLDFESGATGVYHAPWFAPGGWRVTVAADGLSLTFAPIEQALVRRYDQEPITLSASGADRTYKPGFHGQAVAFLDLLRTGTLPPGAADLREYLESVKLVERLTV